MWVTVAQRTYVVCSVTHPNLNSFTPFQIDHAALCAQRLLLCRLCVDASNQLILVDSVYVHILTVLDYFEGYKDEEIGQCILS